MQTAPQHTIPLRLEEPVAAVIVSSTMMNLVDVATSITTNKQAVISCKQLRMRTKQQD
jgi:hypothetical protein